MKEETEERDNGGRRRNRRGEEIKSIPLRVLSKI